MVSRPRGATSVVPEKSFVCLCRCDLDPESQTASERGRGEVLMGLGQAGKGKEVDGVPGAPGCPFFISQALPEVPCVSAHCGAARFMVSRKFLGVPPPGSPPEF